MEFLKSVTKFLDNLAKYLKLVDSFRVGITAMNDDLKTQIGEKPKTDEKTE